MSEEKEFFGEEGSETKSAQPSGSGAASQQQKKKGDTKSMVIIAACSVAFIGGVVYKGYQMFAPSPKPMLTLAQIQAQNPGFESVVQPAAPAVDPNAGFAPPAGPSAAPGSEPVGVPADPNAATPAPVVPPVAGAPVQVDPGAAPGATPPAGAPAPVVAPVPADGAPPPAGIPSAAGAPVSGFPAPAPGQPAPVSGATVPAQVANVSPQVQPGAASSAELDAARARISELESRLAASESKHVRVSAKPVKHRNKSRPKVITVLKDKGQSAEKKVDAPVQEPETGDEYESDATVGKADIAQISGKQISDQKPKMALQAAIPGRAWLRNMANDETVTVEIGSEVPGLGVVKSIDASAGSVVVGGMVLKAGE